MVTSRRSLSVCIALICICTSAFSFYGTKPSARAYWIFFTDKGISGEAFKPGTEIYEKTKARFSSKALLRRTGSITLEDADVYPPYIQQLSLLGIAAVTTSRWLNGITTLLTEDELPIVKGLPIVSAVEPVAVVKDLSELEALSPVFLKTIQAETLSPQALPIPCGYDSIIYHYGFTLSQLVRIGVMPLHAMGFDAAGILIGYLDTGFNPDGMRTTKDQDIVETFDFVYNDTDVSDPPGDPAPADSHGSLVLSAAIGNYPDSIVGPAYHASVMLAKTEDLRSETPLEEGYYAQGLEWLDARGADIASSSLGYLRYDAGYPSITYEMLDGKTTVAARAAVKAARKGMLVVTAAGNGGKDPELPYVMTPGDADSIITVGALAGNDSIADFSSRGPTSDGRIKPDICAPGVGVWTMNRYDGIQPAGGTSLATPLVSSACALIMQSHPEASAQAIRQAVMRSGTRFGPPDTAYGYGRLNAYAAAMELGTIIGPHREWRDDTIHHICVGLAANNTIKSPRVVYAISDSVFANSTALSLVIDSLIYSATFPPIRRGKHIRYYIETKDNADTVTRSPRNAPLSFYEFNVGDTAIIDTPPEGVVPKGLAETVHVYPNPATDRFFVVSSYAKPVQYYLYNISGKEVLRFESSLQQSRVEVQLNALPSGVYILQAYLPGGGPPVLRQTIVRLQ